MSAYQSPRTGKTAVYLLIAVAFVAAVFGIRRFWSRDNTQALPQSITTQENPPGSPSFPLNQGKTAASASSGVNTTGLPLAVPTGFSISTFASRLGNPRDLAITEQGTLIVSIPSAGTVVVLPDKNKDGVADEQRILVRGLLRPHGIAFHGDSLYVAEETAVNQYRWDETKLTATDRKHLVTLPRGGRHFTRTIAFDTKGRMYVSVGSTCDVCVENHPFLASVVVTDTQGNNPQIFSTGLRNAVFLAIHPGTDTVWTTEMGRDNLGDNTPPDEINILRDGQDYGWPYCYGERIHDDNFDPKKQRDCGQTEVPAYKIPAHSAPLGLSFIQSSQFPQDWQGDLLVSYHGSWNRSVATGYKVVRVTIEGDKGTGEEDFLTGFWKQGSAWGRPADVMFDAQGVLYVSDDKAGNIYRIWK